MNGLINYWLRFFYAQNYAFCCSNEYLANQRGETEVAEGWRLKSDEWHLLWWRVGR